MKYVLGFMFNETLTRVALIRKTHPPEQAGLLNGLGGAIEAQRDETPHAAMAREFREEAGMETLGTWIQFCKLDAPTYEVACFYSIGDVTKVKTMTEEKVAVYRIDAQNLLVNKSMPNLRWLLFLAKDFAQNPKPPKNVTVRY